MYFSSIDDGGYGSCANQENGEITKKLPFDSDKLLPDKINNVHKDDTKANRRRANLNIFHAEQMLH